MRRTQSRHPRRQPRESAQAADRPRAWEIVPCVPLPSRGRQQFTYVSQTALLPGALVQIPFGPRTVRGIVWKQTKEIPSRAKEIIRVLHPRLLTELECSWLTDLAPTSLESLALLLKSIVSVREVLSPESTVASSTRSGTYSLTIEWKKPGDDYPISIRRRGQHLILVPDLETARRIGATHPEMLVFAQTRRRSERRALLERLLRGESLTLLSTHSGIFLPLPKLSSLIVIEPALSSHRQWDLHPRYDARIAALLRARAERIPLRLISSLPSSDLSELQNLAVRMIGQMSEPSATVIPRRRGELDLLLPDTERAIGHSLNAGGSVLLFHGVAGGERAYVCQSCGNALRCRECGGILERHASILQCRSCKTVAGPARSFCPVCMSPSLRPKKIGTEAVADELRRRWPRATIVRIDRATLPSRSQKRTAANDISVQGPTIIIGTDRLFTASFSTKVDSAVIVDGDALLAPADYDVAEQALIRIARVASFLKSAHPNSFFLQTQMPDFPLFRALGTGTVSSWMAEERTDRKQLHFPPFVSLLRCERSFSKQEAATREAEKFVETLRAHTACRVGFRILPRGTEAIVEIVIRGPSTELWKLLDQIPRTWALDPFTSMFDLLSSPGQ